MGLKVGELYASLKLNKGEFDRSLAESGGFLRGFGKLALAAGAIVGGVLAVAFKKGSDFAEEFYMSSLKISAVTKMALGPASEWVAVLEKYGIAGDAALKVMGMLTKNVGIITATVKGETKWEKEWGFSLRDSKGHLLSVNAIILKAADYFNNKLIPPVKRAALEAKLFGRGWQQMSLILALGSKGIQQAMDAAKELGLVLTSQNAGILEKYRQSQLALNEAWAGAKLQLGLLIIPLLTWLSRLLTNTVLPAIRKSIDMFKAWWKPSLQLRSTLDLMRLSVVYLAQKIVQNLLIAFTKTRDALRELEKRFGPVIDRVRSLASKAFSDGVVAIADAIGRLSGKSDAILALAGAVLVLNAAVKSNPIVSLVLLAITTIGLLKEAWDKDLGGIRETAGKIYDFFKPAIDAVTGLFDGVGKASGPLQAVLDGIKGFVDAVGPGFRDFVVRLGKFAQSIIDIAGSSIGNLASDLVSLATSIGKLALALTKDALDAINGFLDWATKTGIPAQVIKILADALDFVVKAVTALTDWATNTPEARATILTFLALLTAQSVVSGASALGPALVGIAVGLGGLAATAAPLLLVAAAIGFIFTNLDKLRAGFQQAHVWLWGGIDDLVGTGKLFVDVTNGMVDKVTSAWTTIWKDIGAAWDKITSIITGAVSYLQTVIQGFIDKVQAAIDKVLEFLGLKSKADSGGSPQAPTYQGPPTGGLPPDDRAVVPVTIPHGALNVGGLASGTTSWRGGWTKVGERGPELANLPGGTRVYNADETARILGGGGQQTMNVGPIVLQGVGSDVSAERARAFGQQVADAAAAALRDQTARFIPARA